MLLDRVTKETTDHTRLELDLSPWLDSGESLTHIVASSIALGTTGWSEAPYPPPGSPAPYDPMTLQFGSVTLGSSMLTAFVQEGTPGNVYTCQFILDGTSGRRVTVEAGVQVSGIPPTPPPPVIYPPEPPNPYAGSGSFNLKDFGAKVDGATDDYWSLVEAINAALSLPSGGRVVLPAGRIMIGQAVHVTIPMGKNLTIDGMGINTSDLYFFNPTDGLLFTIANTSGMMGGVHLHSFTLTRGPQSPAISNTGLSVAVASGAMYNGISSLRDLLVHGSGYYISQWHTSVVLAAVSGTTIDNVTILGNNAGPTDLGDILLSLTGGPANQQFGVSFNVVNSVMVGGSGGIDVSGWVQGVFIANTTVIGQYDSIRWVGGGPYLAEQMAVTNCSLNGVHTGFWISGVNQSSINNTVILRFNTGVTSDGFAGIRIDTSGFTSVVNNNIIGANANTEYGIRLKDCTRGPNTIVGNTTGNITTAGISLENSNFNTVVGNNCTGGTIVSDLSGNVIVGNQWDGFAIPNSAMLVSDYVFLTSPAGPSHVVHTRSGATPDVNHPRWFIGDDGTAETGSNTGGNYEIVAVADTGSLLGAPFTINRATGNAAFNAYGGGSLTVSMNGFAAANRMFDFTTNGATRWFVGVGGGTEPGANVGSDFMFVSAADSGTLTQTPLRMVRSTGVVHMQSAPVIGSIVTANDDAEAEAAGVVPGGLYLSDRGLQVRRTGTPETFDLSTIRRS